ncbi:hypothetical protein FS935_18160 [Metabacillus litoralis]|uniref:YfiR C-terminal domain-containing protein n=1 Tax=Metabacillus litoralis TaxID=152268 RepID=A0A5C6VM09_9BACI|nr:hypothetical protein [Metabacillus litoralis]TXC85979.1 hypothetical protein FS935_18160 [Metabacillus litoralis]
MTNIFFEEHIEDIYVKKDISYWNKINEILNNYKSDMYKLIDENNNMLPTTSHHVSINQYSQTKNSLTEYLYLGVENGEFDPQYPLHIVRDFIISMLEGLRTNIIYQYSDKEWIAEQIKMVKERIKDALLVLDLSYPEG